MNQPYLNSHNIYCIPVGHYFGAHPQKCQMVYSPLANLFFLSTPYEVERLERIAGEGNEEDEILNKLLNQNSFDGQNVEVSEDTFCTLHLLLNERCNFKCKYCYSASGRSSAEPHNGHDRTDGRLFLSSRNERP